ncbi:MAG: hypothetical protein WED07_11330 [Candidatus Freyarchaeum deiterrae]
MAENRFGKIFSDKLSSKLSSEDLYSFMVQLEDAYICMVREKETKNEEDLLLLNNIYNSIMEIRDILKQRHFPVEL